ncbi:hypothetical protein L5D93_08245 [Paenibacillus thiaminolyticus]|nr:hypothetical protein [Paenibacillus thiaminolyticus]
MNELLSSFVKIISELESFEDSYSEDCEILRGAFKVPIELASRLAKQYNLFFSENRISFEIRYEGELLGYHLFKSIEKDLEKRTVLLDLAINKKIGFDLPENSFVFFKFEAFTKYFNALNVDFFSNINEDRKIIFHIPIEMDYHNDYVSLYPLEKEEIYQSALLDSQLINEKKRVRKIKEETSNFTDLYPIPELFVFKSVGASLSLCLKKNMFIACLIYLSNKIVNSTSILIRGNKNAEIILSDEIVANESLLYKVYRFSYEEKHYNDKIEITRNIITLYIDTVESLEKFDELLPRIEKTITNHFSAYIQDSIKRFFNDRKEVIKEAHKYATELKSEVDKLLVYINTSLIGVITAIFSGALGLSKGERWYLIVAFVLHIIVFYVSYKFNKEHIENRTREITTLYDKYTSIFVVIAQDDINEIKRIYIDPAVMNVNLYLEKYRKVIKYLIIFVFILALIGIYIPNEYFENAPTNSTVIDAVYNTIK